MAASVTIYTTPYCPFCIRAKSLLRHKGVDFTEIDTTGRPDLRAYLFEASGQRTVPQVFINGKAFGGFSDISALDDRGALDPLLTETPATLPDLPR